MLFEGSSILFWQPADNLGDTPALPRSGKIESTFDRRRHRHLCFLAQAVG
jgi:hypothetical protein